MGRIICKHSMTRGRAGEPGQWCIACGKKALEVEKRPCNECKHSKEQSGSVILICSKKLMGVLPDMKVTYKIDTGTCWEAK